MNQDVNEDGTTPSGFGVSRRSVLKAVGATAVAGGFLAGTAMAQSGDPGDCEGGTAYWKYVLAPAGDALPSTVTLSYTVNGEPGSVTGSPSGQGRGGAGGAIVFPEITNEGSGTISGVSVSTPLGNLRLSESGCRGRDDGCRPCEDVGTSKFNWDGSAFVPDGDNPLGIVMGGNAQNATFESTEGYCVTAVVCGGPGQGQGSGQAGSCLEQVVRCVTQGDGSTSGTLTGIPKPDCWSGDQETPFDISNVTFTCV